MEEQFSPIRYPATVKVKVKCKQRCAILANVAAPLRSPPPLSLVYRFSLLLLLGRSPQICTVTDFEMKTSNFGLFLLILTVSVHFRAIHDETIHGQFRKLFSQFYTGFCVFDVPT